MTLLIVAALLNAAATLGRFVLDWMRWRREQP
jgi:hypothetical protein